MGARGPLVGALVALLATGAFGCDKLKSMSGAGGAGEGGVAEPKATGGGVLSNLFGETFEGEITLNVTGRGAKGGPRAMVFGIKKPKLRIDTVAPSGGEAALVAGSGSIVVDPPAKKAYALVPKEKKAIVFDFEKMKAMRSVPGGPGYKGLPTSAPTTPPTVEKTGKTDVVAGYKCDVWKITSDKQRGEVCVAEGITWIDLGDIGWSSPEVAIAAVASDANRFPLRVVSFDAAGAEELRMEATKIDKKALDEARFAVPADYQLLDLSTIMTGLAGGAGAGGRPPPMPTPRKR